MADYGYGMYDITRRFQSLTILRDTEAASYFAGIVGNYFDYIFLTSSTDIVKIRSCFPSISAIYRSSLRGTGSRPDWSDTHNRRAYILRFFMMHAYLVYLSLQMSLTKLEHSWKYKYRLRVCGLGGGPGSDLVGLVKFLRDSKLLPVSLLECTIGDIYPEWGTDWSHIKRENLHEFPFSVTYLRGNLVEKNSCLTRIGLATIRSADIITMIKSFSTIAAFMRMEDAHGDLLREIFREMKPGALVLYIDNKYNYQHEEFRRIARSGGVSECLFERHEMITMPCAGYSPSIHRVTRATGIDPMDRCNVSIMLLRKPDGILGAHAGSALFR